MAADDPELREAIALSLAGGGPAQAPDVGQDGELAAAAAAGLLFGDSSRRLLDGGLDIDALLESVSTGGKMQATALHAAVTIVRLLLDRGSDPSATSSHGTPLMQALTGTPIMRLLMEAKAGISAADEGGTSFQLACHYDQPDCAEELVRANRRKKQQVAARAVFGQASPARLVRPFCRVFLSVLRHFSGLSKPPREALNRHETREGNGGKTGRNGPDRCWTQ